MSNHLRHLLLIIKDPDPPNPISSFLRTLTLEDPKEPFVLPIVEDIDLDLSDLGLEEVFMTDPKEKEEDDVLRPQRPPSPPPIFSPLSFVPDHQTRLSYSPLQIQNICSLLIMFLPPNGMMSFLT